MNDFNKAAVAGADVSARLAFFKGLQTVTARLHAVRDLDEIVQLLSGEMRELFGAERLTLYTYAETCNELVAQVKTGRGAPHVIRLPVDSASVAGYVASMRQMLNIADVCDSAELRSISPDLQFLRSIDERTGVRSHQMLVAPLQQEDGGPLYGVLQLINHLPGGPFPPILEEGVLALAPALTRALTRCDCADTGLRSPFDALVNDGRLGAAELQQAMRDALEDDADLGQLLIERFSLTPAELGEAAARFYGVTYEPYRADRVKPFGLLRHIKREYVEANRWLPLDHTAEGLIILACDPEQVRASRVVQNVFPDERLLFRVTTESEFDRTVEQFFDETDSAHVNDLLSGLADDEPEPSVAEELNAAKDNELVKLVNKIIVDAYRQGASDIHIEPGAGREKTRIRFRRDGVLMPYIEVPASHRSALITRIKIMCDLDISERRRPQDGKIRFSKYGPADIELRVATVPTAGGIEDVVMRLLTSGEPMPMAHLDLSERNHKRLEQIISRPYGIFFVCGPTGSGKTTTLHSILGQLNTPETKIWTVEDPVEITQKGLRQVQVNRKAGLDFANMMRAFLRADPDILMVGEMRDAETVSVGLEASLTGHLVLTTLHTNSAPESVVRLLDMGMDPFNFADALLGVLAQRLARRLCPHCCEVYEPEESELHDLLQEYCEDLHQLPVFKDDPDAAENVVMHAWRKEHTDADGRFKLCRPVGCDECHQGYKGRIALHELMLGSNALRHQIHNRALVSQVLATALSEGMRTLRQDGIEKVLSGATDMSQVRKVCVR